MLKSRALIWMHILLLICRVYTENQDGQDLALNIKPDVVTIDTNTNLTTFEVSCKASEHILSDNNLTTLTIYKNEYNYLKIETHERELTPALSKSGIFQTALTNENATLEAFMAGEASLTARFHNVTFSSHIGLYRCVALFKSKVGENTSNIITKNATALLAGIKKLQISVKADEVRKSGSVKIVCSLDSPCLIENTLQVFKDGSLYIEFNNDHGQYVDTLCQLGPKQTTSVYNVTEVDTGREIEFACEARYTLPDGQTLTLNSDVNSISVEPTYDKPCKSSNDCLLHEICLMDFCNNSKCSCDEEHFPDGLTCASKKKLGEKCEDCYECSTWLSVCDKLQGKSFSECKCPQNYFYDVNTDSCTNIEPCPADNSFVFSRRDNLCYSINVRCDNCTTWNDACKQNVSVPLSFVGNIREHMIDRLWSYGFYSSSNALKLEGNDEQAMLLLSTTFNLKEDKTTWLWPNGEDIRIEDIDYAEWNDVSDSAENTSCLYMLYDSCHSQIKASRHCPIQNNYRGCLIKLPNAYCDEHTDERNITWEFTEGGTILEKNCTTGYTGTVTRECTIYGEFKTPFYNCTLVLFKNVSNMLESGRVSVPDALAAVSSEVTIVDDVYIGDLIEIQNILGTVVDLSENETISENTTKDYFATASFLLDSDKNGKEWNSRIDNTGEGAEDILPYVEQFAQQVAESLIKSNKSSLRLTQPNIVLQYAAVNTDKSDVEDIKFPNDLRDNPEWNDTKTLSLSLDVTAFSDQGVKAFTCLLYRNLSQSIPKTLRGKSNNSKIDINSQVVSFQLLPVAPKTLNPELEIVFHGFKDMTSTEQLCAYMTTDSDVDGLWSTSGCRKVAGNSTVVTCKCNHLTNFALLISPYRPPEKHASILGILTIVGCSISGVFIFLTLALHIVHWRLMKSDKTILIIVLCIMFLVCYVLFLAGVTQTSNKTLCTAIAVILHYVFLVLFFLMLAEGATVFITVTFPFHRKSHIKELLIVAFVLPLIITITVAGGSKLEGYGNENNCWLTRGTWIFWMFAGPAAFVILVNFITIGLFFRRLFGTKATHLKSMKEKAKMTAVAIGILTPVMGVTWLFGFLSVNEETLWLQYVFCIFNSFQGVLIFLFHCVGNKQLRQAMKARRERKRTIEEINSEMKDKIKKKFADHSNTTTESNFSTVVDKDKPDDKTVKHIRGIINTSENEISTSEGKEIEHLQETLQTELKEKLHEMFPGQTDNERGGKQKTVRKNYEENVCAETEENDDAETEENIDAETEENVDAETEENVDGGTEDNIDAETEENVDATTTEANVDAKTEENVDMETKVNDDVEAKVNDDAETQVNNVASCNNSEGSVQIETPPFIQDSEIYLTSQPPNDVKDLVQDCLEPEAVNVSSLNPNDMSATVDNISQKDDEDRNSPLIEKVLSSTLDCVKTDQKEGTIEQNRENIDKETKKDSDVSRCNTTGLYPENDLTSEKDDHGAVIMNVTDDDRVMLAEKISDMPDGDVTEKEGAGIASEKSIVPKFEPDKSVDEMQHKSDGSIQVDCNSDDIAQERSDIQATKCTTIYKL